MARRPAPQSPRKPASKAQPKAESQRAAPLAVGTVLAVPLADGRWTACQVVGETDARPCVVALAWVGDAEPSLDTLRDTPPLRLDHHNWRGILDWHHVDATPPPPSYRVLGVRPAPALGTCGAFGSWDGFGRQASLQARWERLPEPVRRAYKATPMGPGTELQLDLGPSRVVVREGESRLTVTDGHVPIRWSELDRLPRLTELRYSGADPRMLDYVRARPLLSDLSWSEHGQSAIDLRDTNLLKVAIQVVSPLTLKLPRSIHSLHVSGDARLLTVVQPGDGNALEVTVGPGPSGEPQLPVRGLPALWSLRLVNAAAIRLAPLAAHPGLCRLYLHGQAVRVADIEALAQLPALQRLTLVHCYGIDAARLPLAAEALPALAHVDIDGYRKADAPRWRACLAGIENVELRGAKSDTWLASNLDNPFRDWIDRSPKIGKAACAAWRKARAAFSDKPTAPNPEPVLRALIAVFNSLDKKHGLDTADREEVGEAFHALAALAGVTDATAASWFDSWRTF